MTAERTRFWWIRHAPVEHGGLFYGGDSDLPAQLDASDTSWRTLASVLPRDAVWITSGMQRTRQTAEALLPHISPAPSVAHDPRFIEQRFGELEGVSWDTLHARHGETLFAHLLSPSPGEGESFAELQARVGAGVSDLLAQCGGRDVVVVAHGGVVRAALSLALGLSGLRTLQIIVANNSLTCLEHYAGEAEGAWYLRHLNWTTAPLAA